MSTSGRLGGDIQHKKLIGRIIFANILELPLKKYRRFIENTENLLFFDKLRACQPRNDIKVKRLSRAGISRKTKSYSPNVVAEITRRSDDFSIRYTHEGFNKVYLIDKLLNERVRANHRSGPHESMPAPCERSEFTEFQSTPVPLDDEVYLMWLFRVRRLSSRNELTHKILKGIIEHQRKYLRTGEPIDLVPFSQVQLPIENSWTSRLANRLSVIIPSGEEKPLKWFFQTQKDINKRLVKQLLDKENEDIESGRLKKPLTDNQIRVELESEYGVRRSRHSIGLCRKDMGIPPANRRLSGYKYPPLSANFSMLYPMTIESVVKFAPEKSGVYEFSIKKKIRDTVFYIGSSGNIKKRLREHLGRNSKNGRIKVFLKKYECSFRYIQFSRNWKEEERRLYKLFVATYGLAPKCNRVRP
ncbi:MAG: GIY-YIG nuclease family protein [Candidatus Euphemobacter frigidus]|nr:GIY-YIG nuclease family protein [Candidatus Euphemobacter frigidus]